MANPNPPITAINGNILITILNGNISSNTNTETIQGFLLSGSLTTDSGIGDNIGEVGVNIVSGASYTATNGTFTNLETFSAGGGTGMTVNVTVAASAVTIMQIVNGGSGYSIGDFIGVKESTLQAAGSNLASGTLTSRALTASDLTGGGTPYMVNFNPSPVSASFNAIPDDQKLLIGGPQLAVYNAYNTTISSSLYNTNLPQTANNNKGAGTLLWTTSGSDPANANNYMTWAADGSDAESYQDSNIPFTLERGDIIRVEGIKNITDAATNSSSSINIEEDFIVQETLPYYYSSSFDINQQQRNSLDGQVGSAAVAVNRYLTNAGGNYTTYRASNPQSLVFTTFVGGPTEADGNPGRVGTIGPVNGSGANYTLNQVYQTTAVDSSGNPSNGTGATIKVLTMTGTTPVTVGLVTPGSGYEENDVLTLSAGSSNSGCTVVALIICDNLTTVTRDGVVLTGAASKALGGRIDLQSDIVAQSPGWTLATLSEGTGYQVGDIITIGAGQNTRPGQWSDPLYDSLPGSAGTALTFEVADVIMGNTSFNNNFTVGVDVNSSIVGGPGALTPSGSQVGYHLYEKGEVGFTANTFVRVEPDPITTLNGLLLGEVKKFTVRRQIEADDKVMLKNITPPSGSRGRQTPSGQGFLIPNDFSNIQKNNALNIINQLKAKNAFDKPNEPGITDGGTSISVEGSGSSTIINIP